MVVLDLPRGFDKVVTSCNILIPCNMTYGLLRSVSLAMECTHRSHLSDRLLYLSYFQEIAVLLKSWFDAGLSGLMITGARLDSINLQLTQTGFAHAWQTAHRHTHALRICLNVGDILCMVCRRETCCTRY